MPRAITLEHVTKTYHRGKVRHRDLRGTLAAWWQAPPPQETFNALQDVSFAIEEGDVVGLIGANGAGKSTLLKLLSRITYPTKGRIRIRGTLSSMLEVGTGFHPELTGRDNIYLNGAIIGMRRQEVRSKLDSIVEFSGIEAFLDTPVKHYSSGMYVRLAFSVAAHLDPDILLVDEVLAVGDQAFRKKCFDKLADVSGQGRTIILVSHQMNYLQHLCQRGLWLDAGHLRADGPIDEVIEQYAGAHGRETDTTLAHRPDRRGNGQVRMTRIGLEDDHGRPMPAAVAGQSMVVSLRLEHAGIIEPQPAEVLLEITDAYGQPVLVAGNAYSGESITLHGNSSELRCRFDRLPLNTQVYSIQASIRLGQTLADQVDRAMVFDVEPGLFYPSGKLPVSSKGFLADYAWRSSAG